MKKSKLRLLIVVSKLINENNLRIIMGSIFLAGLLFYIRTDKFDVGDIIDFTIITAFIFVYFVKIISTFLSKYFSNVLEDYIKLSNDYTGLIKKYPLEDNIFIYDNINSINKEYYRDKTESKTVSEETHNRYKYKFPIIVYDVLDKQSMSIVDAPDQWYQQPDIVKKNFLRLFEAHSTSRIYNQTNIRLDKIEFIGKDIELYTSRTTYYDSLVTNRVMDYNLMNNITLRDLMNPGPYFLKLEHSQLSNHIGFNVFLKTKENDVIFVKRSMDVSIGKGTLGPSIAASLKTRYCLDKELKFTPDQLINAIVNEISDELGLEINSRHLSISKNLIAFYRDLIEGGKPQFLFKLDLDSSNEDVLTAFNKNIKKKDKKYQTIQDGKKIVFINISDLNEIYICPEAIFYKGKKYLTLPTVSGTFGFYLEKVIRNENN